MNSMIIILLIVCALSLVTLMASIARLRDYARQFRLEENRYTLLFGFINLRAFIAMYIVAVLGFVLFLLVYILYFFNAG